MTLERRGHCPGISRPMATGDGFLARMTPTSPISIDAFIALCEASQAHGNGIMEVTQRGSLQVRGLSPASAPAFVRTVTALELAGEGTPAVLTSPLLGLDPGESADMRGLASALLKELSEGADLPSIAPKVSVLIDGGGALHMDDVPCDLRLRASKGFGLHMSIAGRAQDSMSLGWMEPRHAVRAVVRVLTAIGRRGADARATDFANAEDTHALRVSLADILSATSTIGATSMPAPTPRPRAEPIGIHPLSSGMQARGFALPFGYIDAQSLRRLTLAAARCGATSIRPAPGRALLVLGLRSAAVDELTVAATQENLITQPDDARRHVVACAGAPACASAMLPTRQLAAQVAEAAGALLDGSVTIHLSGCAKGCAHPEAAALTLVGPGQLVVNGRAGDVPRGTISAADFIAGLRGLHSEQSGSLAALLRESDFAWRLGAAHGEFARD